MVDHHIRPADGACMVTSQSCGSGHQRLTPGESKPGHKRPGW
nr:MAG TPA_asm: hypothetical protein [Caudoviricetes sp.]